MYFIFTACIRSTTGGYVFTGVCLSNLWGGGVPHPADREGEYPILGPGRVVSHPTDRDTHPRSRWGVPIQLTEGTLGYTPVEPWDGVPPIQDWMGYSPVQTYDWVPPLRRLDGIHPTPLPHQETEQHSMHLLHGGSTWQVTYDLPLLETSKVYSGFLIDGVLLLNVWFSQLQVRMVNALSGTSKRVCLTTIHVLFSSSHTQFLLYVSLITQLCIYISKCPCPCY